MRPPISIIFTLPLFTTENDPMQPEPDFQAIRKEYEDAGIDDASLPSVPMEMFRQWYEVAQQHQPAPWMESNAMAIATSDSSGIVTNRIVLLKGIEDSGVRFFTNYDSRKGKQMAENPNVAVAFHWSYLGRQVRMEGKVEKTSREVSESYFHSRPRGSQISAAVSPQSVAVESREQLKAMSKELEEKYAGQAIPFAGKLGWLLDRGRSLLSSGKVVRTAAMIVWFIAEMRMANGLESG